MNDLPLYRLRWQRQRDQFLQLVANRVPHPSANLSIRTPPSTTAIPASRSRFAGSPRNKIPRSTTTLAPIAVHTAYAVPAGMLCMASDSKKKLIPPEASVSKLGQSLVKPSEKSRPTTIPASNSPATNKSIQAIPIAPLRGFRSLFSGSGERITLPPSTHSPEHSLEDSAPPFGVMARSRQEQAARFVHWQRPGEVVTLSQLAP